MLCKKLARKLRIGYAYLLLIPAAAFSLNVGLAQPLPSSLLTPLAHDTMITVNTDSLTVKPLTISLNRHVTSFVEDYIKREEEFLQKMKGKSRSYFSTIETVFAKYDLPPQLKYLAIVESSLEQKIKSTAGARGLWQLMPQTARELGLKISGKTDERIYTYRSTVAAAKYLRALYTHFGDWLLVLAAYNSGPGTVYAAMKKAGSKNYWVIQRFLPSESRGHVKRFIGIHFFFEGEGSITTQTAAEAKVWQERCGNETETAAR